MANLKAELDRLHLLAGRINAEFNAIELYWYLIFTQLLVGIDRAIADAIFNELRGGSQQRKMLLAIAREKLKSKPEQLARLTDLINASRAVADRRNSVMHSALYIQNFAIPPRIGAMGIGRRAALADKEIPAELAGLYEAASLLVFAIAKLRLDLGDDPTAMKDEMDRLETERMEFIEGLKTDEALMPIS